MVEEVGVAQVHAVEDADDHEGRTQLRPERIDALDDLHRGPQAIGTVGRPAGATNTLSGASRPDAALAIATRAPSGARRRYRSPGPGRPAAGRTNWPRAIAATSSADRTTIGKPSRPVSSGRSSGTSPAGPSSAAVRITSSGVAPSSVNGPEAVRVNAPRYAAPPRLAPRSRASARL